VRAAEGTRSVLKPDQAGRKEAFCPWVCCWRLVLSLLLASCFLLVACCFRFLGSMARSPSTSGMGIFEDGKGVFKQLEVRVDESRGVEG